VGRKGQGGLLQGGAGGISINYLLILPRLQHLPPRLAISQLRHISWITLHLTDKVRLFAGGDSRSSMLGINPSSQANQLCSTRVRKLLLAQTAL
jgi:hypothetical protein